MNDQLIISKQPASLDDWITYIDQVHPLEMDLSLDRIRAVAQRMNLLAFDCPVVTVAGTNGKGSCVCLLENIYTEQGYKVASYTSPHLHSYNERIKLARSPISDHDLIFALKRVDDARDSVLLTIFEFLVLAAFDYFKRQSPDVILLEVGLGGRLDAVNIVDADVAVITSISLDHTDRLGKTREAIAQEKAGIFKSGKVAIVGDPNPPASIDKVSRETGCEISFVNKDFSYVYNADSWSYMGRIQTLHHLNKPKLHMASAATSLAVVEALSHQLNVELPAINKGLTKANLPGRYECHSKPVSIIYDVAHNPAATEELATRMCLDSAKKSKTVAVLGMLADKLIVESLRPLCSLIDSWYVATLDEDRGATADEIVNKLKTLGAKNCYTFDRVALAMQQAVGYAQSQKDCDLLVFGSFYTVAKAQQYVHDHKER